MRARCFAAKPIAWSAVALQSVAALCCLLAAAALQAQVTSPASPDGLLLHPSAPVVVQPEPQGTQPEAVPAGEPFVADAAPTGLPSATAYDPYAFGPYNEYVPPIPYSEYCRWTRVYRSFFLGRLWAQGELLAWSTKSADYPPLITSAPLGTPAADAGQLDQPETEIRFGGASLHDEMRLGGRLTIGLWWDPSQWGGIQGSYFGVEGKEVRARFAGSGNDIYARPFIDVTTGLEEARLSIYPGILEGSITTEADTDLQGFEALLRRMLVSAPSYRIDAVAGYRHARLYDNFFLQESLLSLDPSSGFPVDTSIERLDQFSTVSQFHGGEIGLYTHSGRGCWTLNTVSKIALGATHSDLNIDGFTTTLDETDPLALPVTTSGGLLAQPTNIGHHDNVDVAFMTEFGISLVYEIDCNLHASLGYTVLYWNRVARVGDQIDRGVNPTQFPPGVLAGEARPAADLELTDYWAQGLTFSIHKQF